MPSTPISSACLMRTWSFHGTRTIGTVSVPLKPISVVCSGARSQATCSVSISRKSKPTRASTSATQGSVRLSQAPKTALPSLSLAFSARTRPSEPQPPPLTCRPSASDTHILLAFDLIGIEVHIGARRRRQVDRAFDRPKRMLQEMHMELVPFDQVFLVRRMDRRLRDGEMDADRRRMAVWNGDQIVRSRVSGDFERLAEAAGPIDVGLQDIERVLLDEALEAPARIFVLGAGQRNLRLGLELDMAVDAVGHEAFLDPARPELLDARAEIHRIVEIEALPAIDHDVVIVAERLAQRAHQRDVLFHAVMAAHRPVADEPFLRGIALFLIAQRALLDLAEILDGVAEHRGVGRDLVAGRAAENAPDRLVEDPALQVPQRAIDGRDGDHHMALAAMHLQAMHLVP